MSKVTYAHETALQAHLKAAEVLVLGFIGAMEKCYKPSAASTRACKGASWAHAHAHAIIVQTMSHYSTIARLWAAVKALTTM